MKDLKRLLMLGLLITVIGSMKGTAGMVLQPGARVSFQTFYDELSPYGEWVNYEDYGQVWVPDVEKDFQPYGTRGQWVITEYGNTWVSDYDWGWAPFHYGRWLFDDYYGWLWVPGSEWGPAWVNWRSGGGYYGWAPLSPGLLIDININIPLSRWIFVPQLYITNRSVYNYCLPRNRYSGIYGRTTVINNIYVNNNHRYFSGPDRREMERVTRRRVDVHQVYGSNRPGRAVADRGSLRIYRPEVIGRNNSNRNEDNRNGRPTNDRDSRDGRNTRPSTTTGRTPGTDNRNGNNTEATPRGQNGNSSNSWENRPLRTDRTDAPNNTSDRVTRIPQTSRPAETNSSDKNSNGATRAPQTSKPAETNTSRDIPNRVTRTPQRTPSSETPPQRQVEQQKRTQPQEAQPRERPSQATPQVSRPTERVQSPERSNDNKGSSSNSRPTRSGSR
ncbi:hypothetical protein ADIARSV_1398 [Arcticibacter svalbardensis MN12-7]|uniref:Prolin-rich transmembrane protein n=1 Tax=Arcticibacter svalbardensis MN12-7 TaxID=1150600 RepID=R9GU59_9SPHI|nr:DUF6600 domain-containing protein [Arcticibacter svalbardensis]EOR95397.1 hypothetical protein ADIARSV_1398 [Arcticibacter svalbardensis MN12-7]